MLLADCVIMLTNGPTATIGETQRIDLPRPQDRLSLAGHPRCTAYRGEILQFLYRKQMRAAA